MTTFVLVHGAWAGAHGFRLVRPILQNAGHEVFTPSLTGIGERVHLASPQVNLTTHVDDVVNTILYEDLQNIVLLGFSYGGMVVTGALPHIGDRVSQMVYLDAFVPMDGENVGALAGATSEKRTVGEEWLVPAMPRDYDDKSIVDWSNARRTPHPSRCFTEAVRVPKAIDSYDFGRTFVKATDSDRSAGTDPFWPAADRLRDNPAWSYREIATNHMIPENRPTELAELLLTLAD